MGDSIIKVTGTTPTPVGGQAEVAVTYTAFDNEVFGLIVDAADIDKLNTNLYTAITGLAIQQDATDDNLAELLLPGENLYQEKSKSMAYPDGEPIPGAWRSAKSAVKKALKAGVSLLKDEGTPLPDGYKTMGVAEIADLIAPKGTITSRAKAAMGEDVNEDYTFVINTLSKLRRRLDNGKFNEAQYTLIYNTVSELATVVVAQSGANDETIITAAGETEATAE